MLPPVSIVILAWNHVLDTVECLLSLTRLEYSNLRIVLVDNGSTDDTVTRVREQFPNVHIIENKRNLGFVAGNNVGIRYALDTNAAYIFLVNDDTVAASRDLVSQLVRAGENDPQVGILTPSVISYFDRAKAYFGARIDWDTGKGREDDRPAGETRDTDFAQGCALLIKAQVVHRIGLLDPTYYNYFEDADWSMRCKHAGYRVVVVPQARIYHKGTGDHLQTKSPNAVFFARRNQYRFIRKYAPWRRQFAMFRQSTRECLLHFEYLSRDDKPAQAEAIIDGLWAGITGQRGPRRTIAPAWFKRLARERNGWLLLFTEPFPEFVRHFPWRNIPRALWRAVRSIVRH